MRDAERLAIADQAFLRSDEMRSPRCAMEYQKPENTQRRWGMPTTAVVLGSARIPASEDAAASVVAAAPGPVCARAEALAPLSPWHAVARALARRRASPAWVRRRCRGRAPISAAWWRERRRHGRG